MEISSKELRNLVDEVDDQHHESMRGLRDELGELHFGSTARSLESSRRSFLRKAGVGGAVITAGGFAIPFARIIPAAAQEGDDINVVLAGAAAGVELAAVTAYTLAGERGLLDDATLGLATTFAGHHAAHAGVFNSLLGDSPVTGDGNTALLELFGPMIAEATDAAGLLEVAYTLEQAAASTYYAALGLLTLDVAIENVAKILPVEAQHAVVLGTALAKPADEVTPVEETDALFESSVREAVGL